MYHYDAIQPPLPTDTLPCGRGTDAAVEAMEAEAAAETPAPWLPWSDRKPEEWRAGGVTPAEAARLLVLARAQLAQRGSPNGRHDAGGTDGSTAMEADGQLPDLLDPQTLAAYGLTALPTAYDPQELREHAAQVDLDTDLTVHGEADVPTLAAQLRRLFAPVGGTAAVPAQRSGQEILASPLFPLLTTMRRLRAQRQREDQQRALGVQAAAAVLSAAEHGSARRPTALPARVSTTGHAPLRDPLPVAAAKELGWSKHQQDDATARYHSLLNLFFPQVRMYAGSGSLQSSRYQQDPFALSRVEQEQAVFEALSRATVAFFWETAAIDATWTVARFVRYVRKACRQSHAWERFDTRTLEVPEAAWRARMSATDGGAAANPEAFYTSADHLEDETADRAIERLVHADLAAMVSELAAGHPREAEAFLLSTFSGYTLEKVGKRQGVSRDVASRRRSDFGALLAARLALDYPDTVAQYRSPVLGRGTRANAQPEPTPEQEQERSCAEEQLGTVPAEVRRRSLGPTSPMWAELGTKHYTEDQMLVLPPAHRDVVETALRVAQEVPPERNAILDKVCASHPGVARTTVRRMIQGGIRLLEHRPEAQRGENRGSVKRRQRTMLAGVFRRMQEDEPEHWSALPELWRHFIEAYYLDDSQPSETAVAALLGFHQSTANRLHNRLTRHYIRSRPGMGRR